MTRRARLRLLIVLVVLGVPALAVGIGLWYLGTGRLERRLAYEYRRRLPGELSIGRIELQGLGRAELRDVAIGPLGSPAIQAAKVTVAGSLAAGDLREVRIEGLHGRIDRAVVAWLVELGRALRAGAADDRVAGPARDFDLVVTGGLDLGGAMPVADLLLRGALRGGALRGRLTASVAEEPYELFIDHEDTAGGVRHTLEVRRAPVRLTPLFHALEALVGMKNQDELLPWLPTVAELSGTRLVLEPGAPTASGPFVASWRGGAGEGALTLGRDGLRLARASVHDRELGEAAGELALDYQPTRLEVDVPAWSPGPRVPIPEKVSLRELFALLPAAHLVQLEEDGEPRMYLTLAPDTSLRSTRHVDVRWRKGDPWRIIAGDLPIDLVRPWIPPALTVTAGRVVRIEVTIDTELRFLEARSDGVAVAGGDWSLADMQPVLTMNPLPAGQDGFDAVIEDPVVHVRHRGDGDAGTFEISIPAGEAVVAHLHGPRPAPALSGRIDAAITWRQGADGVAGDLTALTARGVGLGATWSGIDVDARGSWAWERASHRARVDGTLAAGRLHLAGRDLDLAARTPQFTVSLAAENGQLGLTELLAKAAGDDGFTLGMHGKLNPESLDGELAIAVDRADLGWLSEHGELIPLPKKTRLAGQMALTATARIADAAIERIDGWVLPLGTDLQLADGAITINGVKGAIAFRIAPPPPPPTEPKK